MKDDPKKLLSDAIKSTLSGEMDQNIAMLELFSGTDEAGNAMYAIVAVKPSKLLEYRAKLENGEEIELEDYGEILEQGHGALPPKDIRQKYEAEGFSFTYEDDVLAALEKSKK